MESARFDKQRGQILVQVAIMVGVLFAFVALAVDGGQVYGGRRRMQNAADAGALAGAREICFGGHDSADVEAEAEGAALEYAKDRNDAHEARVDVLGGYTVTVVATQTLDTFFAGVIGINEANVQAEAAAICGRAVQAGDLWPIAFSYSTYSESVECGQDFLVFADDDEVDCADPDCGCLTQDAIDAEEEYTGTCEEECDCDAMGPHLGPGSRGWLRFFESEEGYPDADCANQGVNALACWLEHGHPGPINEGDCVAGKPGVSGSSQVDTAITGRISDVVSVLLYDRPCNESGDPATLGGAPASDEQVYHVGGFGCVQVIGWYDKYWIPMCGSDNKDPQRNVDACMDFLKAVEVKKICKDEPDPDLYDLYCGTTIGAASGELPKDLELRGVALIQWPPPDGE